MQLVYVHAWTHLEAAKVMPAKGMQCSYWCQLDNIISVQIEEGSLHRVKLQV